MFIVIYIVFILLIAYLQKKDFLSGIFKITKKTSWFISGISLFMYYTSVEEGQIITGILLNQGVFGLWLYWSGLLGCFFMPFIFAPLWSKLDFITDNQFLLFRYSGYSAKILHAFRSIYVGGIVVCFLLSFHCIAFSRVIQIYFDLEQIKATAIVIIIMCVFALKNSFQLKLKSDFFNAIIYFIVIALLFYFSFQYAGGWSEALFKFKALGNYNTAIFPNKNDIVSWHTLFVFAGIQWWSAQLFDGGGPETARFTAVKGRWNAILTACLPVILYAALSILMTCLCILLIAAFPQNIKGESNFIYSAFKVLPDYLDELCLLGFFGVFITTAESIMNWGSSFITIDFYKTYIKPNKKESHYQIVGLFVMFCLALIAGVISINISSLQDIVKLVFSISAGVAPVYILRWFCFRINAWTQLSAMISSGLYTLLFPLLYDDTTMLFNLKFEEIRLVVVTLFTTLTWLLVMFLTKKDDEVIIQRFKANMPPSKTVLLNSLLALLCGSFMLFLVLFIYHQIL